MNIRELKKRWRRRQRERKEKQSAEIHKTTTLHVHLIITLCCTFLCRHCTNTTWNFPIFTFYVLNVNWGQRLFIFFFLNSETDLKNLTPEKFVIMWQIERLKKKANSFFEWRCRSRGRRFCLSSLLKNYKRTITINGNLQLKIKNNCPEHPAKFA